MKTDDDIHVAIALESMCQAIRSLMDGNTEFAKANIDIADEHIGKLWKVGRSVATWTDTDRS